MGRRYGRTFRPYLPRPEGEEVACIRAAWRASVQTRHWLAVRVCSDQTREAGHHPGRLAIEKQLCRADGHRIQIRWLALVVGGGRRGLLRWL
jgi:hypothetical protein